MPQKTEHLQNFLLHFKDQNLCCNHCNKQILSFLKYFNKSNLVTLTRWICISITKKKKRNKDKENEKTAFKAENKWKSLLMTKTQEKHKLQKSRKTHLSDRRKTKLNLDKRSPESIRIVDNYSYLVSVHGANKHNNALTKEKAK
ncbi:hypothetical protein RFI_02372 [Reticulomyxa filosa]|uniref:Alsin helical array domain-containing protein n=1 Tax=Reticulomyxa filosa TaxID=46433 RepID=X6P967_RETFI|nr:hypothetical protein RFI_02372 [Reticulomyxa filosa]|eukprot:ETO34726.1 hypothetical protein RFI_02372 [Reticulomyxa filosa]